MVDQVDQIRIQTQIDIIRKTIKNWEAILYAPLCTEELYIQARSNIEREERNLQQLKDKYPEYFI
jgi:hypothetical protein